MFDTILIANRGEIACRVIRTARHLGIRTVAVYSEADAGALHAAMADTAYCIGPAPARDSYLDVGRILDVARRSGAQAVHPGYGFLSENAEFAAACAVAGIVFIGPPPGAIRAMGSKSAAKTLMQQAGVPLVPGYHGAEQDPAHLAGEAARIGYPVLIKASAGGGGKGMRVVDDAAGFNEALALAKGEARSSFGDDTMLIERYLTRPRHIEIQVFADAHGNVVSLFERDCSIQRRHQKVIEEAPAPGMGPARRASMGEAACAAARAIGYVGAGTVEFIVAAGSGAKLIPDDGFFFMEMNTRLQVEHPVTEMITGQDLVEWQLLVASGAPLPLPQDQLRIDGHAIEARVYAEDPDRDFMPAVGTLTHLQAPAEGAHVRVDTGVRTGDSISIHYDPMIAKLIVWDRDRPSAVRRLAHALSEYQVVGLQTNLGLLRRIAAHPAFSAAELDTGFIGRHGTDLLPKREPAPAAALAAAALRVLQDRAKSRAAVGSHDPFSPWNLPTAWRMNGDGYQDMVLAEGDTLHAVRAHPRADGSVRLDLPGGTVDAAGGTLDGVRRTIPVIRNGDLLTAILDGANYPLALVDPLAPPHAEVAGGDRLLAPMPGRVVEVLVRPGDAVLRGDVLMVLEAMKVQMRLAAPRAGVVDALRAAPGDLVDDGAELVSFVLAEQKPETS
jgi:3-methylcrotonyl-CoA carboxylase alpha subunit